MKKGAERENRYFRFLKRLRAGGRSNMYGAIPYLSAAFGCDRDEAFRIVCEWVDAETALQPESDRPAPRRQTFTSLAGEEREPTLFDSAPAVRVPVAAAPARPASPARRARPAAAAPTPRKQAVTRKKSQKARKASRRRAA